MKKIALTISGLALVVGAQATVFISLSNGSVSFSGPNYTTSEVVMFSSIPSLTLGSTMTFTAPFSNGSTGTATFTNGGSSMVLDVTLGSFSNSVPGTSSVAGTWVYDDSASTGVFHGFSGSGTFGQSLISSANSFAATSFVGDVAAVPEPVSIALLATGVVGLLRRRK